MADFNGDGKPDLVTTNLSTNTVSVLLNSCAPTDADLTLRQTVAAETAQTGTTVTWTITVANRGPNEARSVVVNNRLDSRTAFLNCTANNGGVCGGTGNHRTVTFPALSAGAEATITMTARLNCAVADGARIVNIATVAAATPDPNSENNSASAVVRAVNPPPRITNASVDKPVLWPPNHKFVEVTVNYDVTDNCDAPAALNCQLSIRSNEPITPADWEIVDAHHIRLRAERSGQSQGRIYTVVISCRDSGGNRSEACVNVTVPKSQGK